ncbi:hypothetical protein MPTK1_2g07140 [Marchantia polymorpha subsp. ruderalis]|uniref:Uncharacterized protein n=1 Tax=Marchantia polymorpha TaxID=3197 RepID=A0A2R6XGE2_MARPO|nr:hypothetical protein MARPO_0015s0002 [Marchantia polymorpha]BBN01402.1 hypothetical protein Mp_2g07140 [Marchantia polymorpha subsp. ruderalis]|eukprot:PTQ45172.1 hypothetical protein MARPO_0015s0002 [Marchantia polymorpha]
MILLSGHSHVRGRSRDATSAGSTAELGSSIALSQRSLARSLARARLDFRHAHGIVDDSQLASRRLGSPRMVRRGVPIWACLHYSGVFFPSQAEQQLPQHSTPAVSALSLQKVQGQHRSFTLTREVLLDTG